MDEEGGRRQENETLTGRRGDEPRPGCILTGGRGRRERNDLRSVRG